MGMIPHPWLVASLKKTHLILGSILDSVTQEQAQQLTDGPDGWSILEIMCHLRDFQEIDLERAQRILGEDVPLLVVYDAAAREAMVTERDYAHQNLKAVFNDYVNTRLRFLELVSGIDETLWDRVGQHPMYGEIDVTVPVFHAVMHDADHTEQIARVLGMSFP
jgi:hypothetical protein